MINTLSKGRMLSSVEDKLSIFKVPKLLIISVIEWNESQNGCLINLQNFFNDKLIIVRSSASDEDLNNSSLAGL